MKCFLVSSFKVWGKYYLKSPGIVDYVPYEIKLLETVKNIWRPKVTYFR